MSVENEIIEDNLSTGALTEERVTRKVIRRRRSAGGEGEGEGQEMPEPEVMAALPEPMPEPVVEEEQASRSVKRKIAARGKAIAAPSLKKIEKLDAPEHVSPVVRKAPVKIIPEEVLTEDATPVSQTPSTSMGGYRKIKVVGTLPKMPDPALRKPRNWGQPEPEPSSAPVSRKEIVEIRTMHRPKGPAYSRGKRRMPPGKEGKKTEITTPKAAKRVVRMTEAITVSEMARRLSVKVGEVITKLLNMGMVVTINQNIDVDTASLLANEFGYEVENVAVVAEDLLEAQEKELDTKPEDQKTRAPVVTVMGHVDHGKTSLLDKIRKADVASGEAGGITQHIGAYSVVMPDGRSITFIDTPGHKAFTSMRARGAQVTDIVILVVAGDDGVMPQTKEAVNHAQSAKVPIIVAINKMDKSGVDPERIKKELTEFQMVPEEWGGETIYVPVSAHTGAGIAQLLEFVLLQADVLELTANPDRPARGVVLESSMDKRRGVVTTILVQEGTLKEGDTIVAGTHVGRVKAMKDDKSKPVPIAGPSAAVEVMGLSGVATAGDTFSVVTDEKKAKQISQLKYNQQRQKELAKTSKVSLDDLYQQIALGDVKELRVVVKADTAGSVEVLAKALEELSTAKVTVKVIHGAVGGVSENDVMLASASKAIVVSFHVRPEASVRRIAEQHGVEMRYYEVIYELTDEIIKAMAGLLAPKIVEKILGHAEVRQVFSIPKAGTIAGCYLSDGKIQRNLRVRLIRDSVQVYTGDLSSLKRFKDDVREVSEGQECGLGIHNFNDIKVGDVVEAFEVQEVAASLE